ncbi:MAG: molybdopterin-dependent oxidoreductase [Steroidobacteraceae bacterium]
MLQQHHSVCRMCHAGCDLLVTMEEGKVVSIIGDKHNPAYHGYTCVKGRESATVHTLPSRLLSAHKRHEDGTYRAMGHEQVTQEVAERLQSIISKHGSASVAYYSGTFGSVIPSGWAMGKALMQGIGSPMFFTSATIDQPGKFIAPAHHGRWLAGPLAIKDWDAMLLMGANPIISMGGALSVNPARQLKKCLDRGMKLVVVDPRRSDCAKKATIHLQCRPREDATILAGIIRCLLREELIDTAFVNAEAEGLDELRAAVEPFTPEYVARRAGIKAEDLIEAARILGRAKGGSVYSGTGSNMAGHCNLVEYLGRCIHTLRGWWLRAGAEKYNPGVFIEMLPPIAGTTGPEPVNVGVKLRTRGLSETPAGVPTAALADEILTPGAGQIRALIVVGGNPMVAFPDQLKTHRALKSLELLVCIDPRLSETARLAHYVLAPKLALEVENNSAVTEIQGVIIPGMDYQLPYGQATPAVMQPPTGADVLEEWEWLYLIARHMKLPLHITPFSILDPKRAAEMTTPVDMQSMPSTPDVWRMVLKGAPIPYDEVRTSSEGKVYPRRVVVQPKPADWTSRLQLGAAPMLKELAEVASESDVIAGYPLRLLSLRMRGTMNSSWRENPRQQPKGRPYNPVFMNPADILDLGIQPGEVVEIRSPRAAIHGVVESLSDVRAGCVSMSHGWGTNPDETDDALAFGGCTSRLIADDVDFDPVTGIPRMSAVPVSITPLRHVPTRPLVAAID